MEKLTAIIPTGNEEHNIVDAIKSVAFADEIMVVDSFSSDRTIELATPLADIILQREYENSASQKNWAIPQAKHNWILLLDADERVTTKLKKEVLSSINSNTDYSAFWIKRQNYFMGKKVSFSGWQGDRVIRLFKRDENKYKNKHVHAEIISSGKIGLLKNIIIHNTFKTKEAYLQKLERYAKWQAKDYDKKIGRITLFHTLIKPAFRFIKHYILQLGILDGLVGFTIASYQAKGVKMRYQYLKEYRNAKGN
jgi:glycosyltransferase involved in cell wall biosynthesis|tara:strand:+ start:327 stop:1082 length:756 start_codon:yes stop_codon:yes gene_type:complete